MALAKEHSGGGGGSLQNKPYFTGGCTTSPKAMRVRRMRSTPTDPYQGDV